MAENTNTQSADDHLRIEVETEISGYRYDQSTPPVLEFGAGRLLYDTRGLTTKNPRGGDVQFE